MGDVQNIVGLVVARPVATNQGANLVNPGPQRVELFGDERPGVRVGTTHRTKEANDLQACSLSLKCGIV